MDKSNITNLIAAKTDRDGLTPTAIKGVQLFRATQPVPCAPAVYEPCLIAIVSGAKEAVLDGRHFVYDSRRYLLCPMSMPIKAGTPNASAECPLYGVFISLDQRVMTELALEMDNVGYRSNATIAGRDTPGIHFADWDDRFTDALSRLVSLTGDDTDAAVLGSARLREVYYAVLRGQAGAFARQAFGPGNAIARSIAHVANNLDQTISIDDLADRAGMSRAVFHRKFKQSTTMSPIQFVKSMRLNNAAMKIAGGMTIAEAAMDVGYVSASQFSREFKRLYGLSPREWGDSHEVTAVA